MSDVPEKIWLRFDERGLPVSAFYTERPPDEQKYTAYVRAPEEPKKERYRIEEGHEGWRIVDDLSGIVAAFVKKDVPHAEQHARDLAKTLNGGG